MTELERVWKGAFDNVNRGGAVSDCRNAFRACKRNNNVEMVGALFFMRSSLEIDGRIVTYIMPDWRRDAP